MKGKPAGKASVELGLDDTEFQTKLRGISNSIKSVGRKMAGIGAGLAGVGASILAPLGAAVKGFAAAGDALGKLSNRSGLSVESLSALGFAAEQSGTSLDQLGNALLRSTRRIANAASGTGPAVRALDELGLAAGDLSKKSPEDRFFALVNALEGVDDQGRKAQLAFEIFGDSSKALLPLLNSGAAGIREMMQEAEDLGAVMSTEDARAAEKFGDAMNGLGKSLTAVRDKIGAALVPELTKMANALKPIAKAVVDWVKENRGLVLTVAKLAVGLVAIGAPLAGLGIAITAIGTAFAAVTANVALFGAALAVLAIAAVATAVYTMSDAIRELNAALKESIKLNSQISGKQTERQRAIVEEANAITDKAEREEFLQKQLAVAEKNASGLASREAAAQKRVDSAGTFKRLTGNKVLAGDQRELAGIQQQRAQAGEFAQQLRLLLKDSQAPPEAAPAAAGSSGRQPLDFSGVAGVLGDLKNKAVEFVTTLGDLNDAEQERLATLMQDIQVAQEDLAAKTQAVAEAKDNAQFLTSSSTEAQFGLGQNSVPEDSLKELKTANELHEKLLTMLED